MDAKFLLGVQEIDIQHSEIFAALEALQQISSETGQHPMLERLHDLLVDHFDYEESFMGSINCPDRQEHQQRHSELKVLLKSLVSTTPLALKDGSIGRMLASTLSNHVLKYDAQMGMTVENLIAQVHRH